MNAGAQAGAWSPALTPGVIAGPPIWNGASMTAEIAIARQPRTWNAGLLELLVIEAIDGDRSLQDIRDQVSSRTGRPVETRVVGEVVGKLVAAGLVVNPYAPPSAKEPTGQDTRASDGREATEDGLLSRIAGAVWRLGPHLQLRLITGAIALGAGATAAWFVFSAGDFMTAVAGIRGGRLADGVIALVLTLAWQLAVIFGHELAHGLAFAAVSDRKPVLSVAKIGRRALPNTKLDGFWLLKSTRQRLAVVLVGPLTSIMSCAVPLAVLANSTHGSLAADWAAMAISLEVAMAFLNLVPMRYSDGTRLWEAWAAVRNLPGLGVARVLGRVRPPEALPVRSRLAISAYLPASIIGSLLLTACLVVWLIVLVRGGAA
ncbi:MAG: hypothetical protein LBC97_16420 [Bifidobacteriaceae bacterium]|nr:hypothetical protein [Bifidobacteriaceae bacterium]